MHRQRVIGNVTRADGATGKGTIATYALTTRGMLKASQTKIKEDAGVMECSLNRLANTARFG